MNEVQSLLKNEYERLSAVIDEMQDAPATDEELTAILRRRQQFVSDLLDSADDPDVVLAKCRTWLNNAQDKHRRSQARFDTPPEKQWWDTLDTMEYVSRLVEQIETRHEQQAQ